jgi:hypothetical protein
MSEIRKSYEEHEMDKHLNELSMRWEFVVNYFELHKTDVYQWFEAAKHGVKNEDLKSLREWINGEREFIRGIGFVNKEDAKIHHDLQKRQFKNLAFEQESSNTGIYARFFNHLRGNTNLRKRRRVMFGSETIGNWV